MVREFGDSLQSDVPRTILDAGTGTGRNAQYLAKLGHTVFGLDVDIPELRAIREANQLDDNLAANLRLVAGDVRRLPFGTVFDVACMNELNLQMSKTATQAALTELRRVTVQGGLNVVSGYMLAPDQGTVQNRARAFAPGELGDIYDACGWAVLSYREVIRPLQTSGGKEIVSSLSMVIAQRRWFDR